MIAGEEVDSASSADHPVATEHPADSGTDFATSRPSWPTIGTAGWGIPARFAEQFGEGGSALERYATRFRCVEINSSFHRSHRPETWARWAESVPPEFRFSVKLPKTISHQRKLVDCSADLDRFFAEAGALGSKLGALLLQLPPKLAFEVDVADAFVSEVSDRCVTTMVCEPRHPSWFGSRADEFLRRRGIPRVAADPPPVAEGALPGGDRSISYWRLHGSPQMYRSSYDCARLRHYGRALRADYLAGRPTWCIFDNTASSAAIENALRIAEMIPREVQPGTSVQPPEERPPHLQLDRASTAPAPIGQIVSAAIAATLTNSVIQISLGSRRGTDDRDIGLGAEEPSDRVKRPMLLVETELRPSPIHGIGVFLLADVRKGDTIWRFDSRIDRIYSDEEIASLPPELQSFIQTYSTWHQASGLWVLCGDNGRHFNHSDNPNTLSRGIAFGDDVAAQDIAAGTELTSDYRTICDTFSARAPHLVFSSEAQAA